MLKVSGALALAAGGLLSGAAAGQTFTNADFETGDLNGWTLTPTFNGATLNQGVESFDIDGPGALGATMAPRFQAGNISTNALTGHQAGITLSQSLNLTGGTAYLISFNWASNLQPPATQNTEGGVFTLTVDGQRLWSENAGFTSAAAPKFGELRHVYIPGSTGAREVGVRITRPFTITTTTNINEWVDNFQIQAVTAGACCFSNGSCVALTSALCTERGGTYAGDNVACGAANCVEPDAVVAPFANDAVIGGSSSNLLTIAAAGRTYQGVIAASELSGALNSPITGISWRVASTTAGQASWPEVAANFSQYDIELSTSNFPPNGLSTTFQDNVGTDAVMVRSGPLTVDVGAFPGGGQTPATNAFGAVIPFTTPFVYQGGDLLITIRHSGNDSGTSRTLDAIATSGTGYGITVQARSATDAAAVTGNAAAFTVVELSVGGGAAPCYPNCDASTTVPVLNVADFTCFLQAFAAGASTANCDGSTTVPVLNVADFTCFLQSFAAGCS